MESSSTAKGPSSSLEILSTHLPTVLSTSGALCSCLTLGPHSLFRICLQDSGTATIFSLPTASEELIFKTSARSVSNTWVGQVSWLPGL